MKPKTRHWIAIIVASVLYTMVKKVGFDLSNAVCCQILFLGLNEWLKKD